MFSPSGQRIAWMRGPLIRLGYHADLYVSTPEFADVVQVTSYNDCSLQPFLCLESGAQLSRLAWNSDGTAIFFGLWKHGPLLPFVGGVDLHRVDFVGACGG